MKFTSFASSSGGNAYMIEDGDSKLLLECGITYKELQKKLDFDIAGLCGCLVTHEHKDHSKCANRLIKDGLTVYMSEGTAMALELSCACICKSEKSFSLGSYFITPFEVFHDSVEPLGYLIRSRADGDNLVFVMDTVNIPYTFSNVNQIAIECNYDNELLVQNKKINEKVKKRVQNTHLEVHQLCSYLSSLDLRKCSHIYLLHLSNGSSNEYRFQKLVKNTVGDGTVVIVCKK